MLIYFITLITVTACALLSRNTRDPLAARFFTMLAFASLVLVAGFRDRSVGTDTGGYVTAFTTTRSLADLWRESSFEPGYLVLSAAVRLVSDQYWALLTGIALVAVFCYMRAIYRHCESPAIALFVFVTMGYYTFFFNGARQGLACAFYALAIGPLLKGDFKRYALWVLVAFCFHKTAIIALPLYFLFRRRSTPLFMALTGICSTVAVFFLRPFLQIGMLISEKYSIYQEMEATGGKLLTAFYAGLVVFFIYFRKSIAPDQQKKYDCFLNMQLVASVIYVVVTASGAYVELTRIAAYFQIASVFLWAMVYRSIPLRKEKFVFQYVFALGHLLFFYIFLSRMASLTPYTFNPDLVYSLGL